LDATLFEVSHPHHALLCLSAAVYRHKTDLIASLAHLSKVFFPRASPQASVFAARALKPREVSSSKGGRSVACHDDQRVSDYVDAP